MQQGSDSGWQTSASYSDTGLSESTQYTYTVTMRDSYGNAGTASAPESATTQSSEVVLEQNSNQSDKTDVKSGQNGAQSFKHGSASDPDYRITKVELKLSRDPEAPSEALEFSIGTSVNGGKIAGSIVDIASSEVTNTSGGRRRHPR